jgi:transcriptional regulator with XRE-family HTH domain
MEQCSALVLDPTFTRSGAYPVSLTGQLQYVSRAESSPHQTIAPTYFGPDFDRFGFFAQTAQVPSQIRMASTGSCFSAANLATALLLLALSAPTGVASGLDFARTSQRLSQIPYYEIVLTADEVAEATFPSRIRFIQKVLAVSISDLAFVLGVSRQAVYKWLSRGPVSDLNRERLEDLTAAANVLAPYAGSQALMLNRRRNIDGLTLVESLRSGASARVWAEEVSQLLIKGRNQRKMMDQMLASHRRSLPALREMGVPLLDEQDD